MQYPRMGNVRPYRVSIPQLNGGLNVSVPPHMIQDNQLSDVKNMWYKDGCLQTRPGVTAVNSFNALNYEPRAPRTFIKTLKARDKMCVISSAVDGAGNGCYLFEFWDMESAKFCGDHQKIDLGKREEAPKNILAVENFAIVKDADGVEHENVEVICYIASTDSNGNSFCEAYGVGYDRAPVKLAPYVPTVIKGGVPQKNAGVVGGLYEPFNLLTNDYKCQYTADGSGVYYALPERYEDGSVELLVTYNSQNYELKKVYGKDQYLWKSEKDNNGMFVFFRPHTGVFYFAKDETLDGVTTTATKTLGVSDSANNVEVFVKKPTSDKGNAISRMTLSTWFGGGSSGLTGGTRLFVAGSDEEPNVMRWGSLNNPLYFPENNYTYVGADSEKITAFGKQSDMLVIFKEKELYFSYYVQGNVSAEAVQNQEVVDIEAARALFPVYPLHSAIGCDLPNTIHLCNNRLVWFNRDRNVYGLFSSGVYNERNVRRLSDQIENKLKKLTDDDIKFAISFEFEDHYLLFANRNVFAMDFSSNGFSYYSSYSSDEKAQKAIGWYCWLLYQSDNEPFNVDFLSAETDGEKTVMFAIDEKDAEQRFCSYVIDLELKKDVVTVKTPTSPETGFNIRSCFATKLFDFGYPERYKRVNPFYLQVSGEDGKTLNLTYLNENGAYVDACRPVLSGEELEKTTPRRISPNAVRVREFGFKAECDGCMEVGSLVLNYAMMGTVR